MALRCMNGQDRPSLTVKNEADKGRENESVEVRHDGKTNSTANHTPEFNAVIRRNSGEHVVRDFLIIGDDGATGCEDDHAGHHPANTEIPIHKLIIA